MKKLIILLSLLLGPILATAAENKNLICDKYVANEFWFVNYDDAFTTTGNGENILRIVRNAEIVSPTNEIAIKGFNSIGTCYNIPLTNADEINSAIRFKQSTRAILSLVETKADIGCPSNTDRIDSGNPNCIELQKSLKNNHLQNILISTVLEYDQSRSAYTFPTPGSNGISYRRVLLSTDKKYLMTLTETKDLYIKTAHQLCVFNNN